MLEFAPKSPLLYYDEAWLYMATCTHNNKYDWRGVRNYSITLADAKIHTIPWRRKDDEINELLEYAPRSEPLLYDDAMLYCYTCTHDGHYDWIHCLEVSGRHTLFIAAPTRVSK